MTTEELRAKADECFASNKEVDMFHQTADGQCFVHWHDANENSKRLGPSNRTVTEVRRDDAKKGTTAAEEKVAQINACKTADELADIKIGNKENKIVKEAMDAKLKEFADAAAKKG